MISAIALACVRANDITVRRVKFTPELKSYLPLFRFAALGDEPLDCVEQHLNLAHTSTTCVQLPALALQRDDPPGGVGHTTVSIDCFGICLYEPTGACDEASAIDDGHEADLPARVFDRLPYVAHHTMSYDEVAEAEGASFGDHSPFSIVPEADDLLGDRRTLGCDRVLKVVSEHKVRAVLLIEATPHEGDYRVRLYANPAAPTATRIWK